MILGAVPREIQGEILGEPLKEAPEGTTSQTLEGTPARNSKNL